MTQINRRGLLGSAAVGADGLIGLAGGAQAASPGGGGFGCNATALPPGDKVVPHERGEKEDMPDFKYSLDGSTLKVTSGGWAKEVTVHQFPISKGIAGVHMFLDPGASRELHWHAIAPEWAYVMEDQCQTVVVGPSGQREVNNFGPGDLWYFPKGHGHAIRNVGTDDLELVVTFGSGIYQETSLSQLLAASPRSLLSNNFGVPEATFAGFPEKPGFIRLPH